MPDVIAEIVFHAMGEKESPEYVAKQIKSFLNYKKVDIGLNAQRPNQIPILKIMTVDGTYKLKVDKKELPYLTKVAVALSQFFPDGTHKIIINDKLWKKMGGNGHPGPKHKAKWKK